MYQVSLEMDNSDQIVGANGDSCKFEIQNSTESSDPSSDDTPISANETKIKTETRAVPDAIHPRFLPRTIYVYQCRSCPLSSTKERKIQKHFLKTCTALEEPLRRSCNKLECDGPTFSYSFRGEIRLYHNCKEWEKFIKSPEGRRFVANNSSINSSTMSLPSSFVSSNLNSTTEVSLAEESDMPSNSQSCSEISANSVHSEMEVPSDDQCSEISATNSVPNLQSVQSNEVIYKVTQV